MYYKARLWHSLNICGWLSNGYNPKLVMIIFMKHHPTPSEIKFKQKFKKGYFFNNFMILSVYTWLAIDLRFQVNFKFDFNYSQ